MAGHALVQLQGLQGRDGARVQHGHVEEQDAGLRSIRRTGAVVARAPLITQRRQRTQLECGTRTTREQLRHPLPDLFLDAFEVADEVFGFGIVELGPGADVFEEGRQVAVEAGRLARLLHRGADPGHFGQADLVDLLRAHRGGGVLDQQGCIDPPAVLHRPQACALGGDRQVAVAQERAPALVGRRGAALDDPAVRGRQAGAVCRPNGVGETRDRGVEGILLDRQLQEGFDLRQDVVHHHLGLVVALGHALLQAIHRTVHVAGEALQLGQPPFVVFDRLEADARQVVGELDVQAEGGVQRHQVADRVDAAVDVAQRLLGLVAERVVGNLVLLAQGGAVDAGQPRQFGALVGRQLPGKGLALRIDEDGPGRGQAALGETQRMERVVRLLALRHQQAKTLTGVRRSPRHRGGRCRH